MNNVELYDNLCTCSARLRVISSLLSDVYSFTRRINVHTCLSSDAYFDFLQSNLQTEVDYFQGLCEDYRKILKNN